MNTGVQQNVLTHLRAFAQEEVATAAAGWSMGQSPDPEMYRRAAELGLMRLELPVDEGGFGLGFDLKARACELLAGADFGFAMSVVNTHNVAHRLCQSAAPAVRSTFLPHLVSGRMSACTALTEPGAGSDLAAIRTRAERRGEGWVLNGEKRWIVNGRHAGLAIVYAQCGDLGDLSGIGAFVVDLSRPGVARYALESAFSQTSMGTGGFGLENLELSGECLLLPPGAALKTILSEINGARTYVAAMCCGMLGAALDQVAGYGESRHAFGRPLAGHQAWRQTLARAETGLAAAQALVTRAVACVTEGEEAQLVAAEAKIFAVQTCQRHLPELLHAMGAAGLSPDSCLTRHLAAAQMAALTDGANSLLCDRIARLIRPETGKTRT